ncbi:DUF5317 family protein [Bacillus sp. ISL-55]|uniref:DUF5317 family protein n=1 Tax=Bacillus sp. ISL-55 TaxID=2819134 RepID=UPI001BE5A6AB|nr:DUF5317 family protein [Bacillus sp. ISL-55]MBT2693618.1 DUF5317 domain-containing protein [Bacillus sp. ISL-55]
MKYFLLLAFVITFSLKKNPLTFFKNVEFQWPLLIIVSFGAQIALAFFTIRTAVKLELVLIATFSGIILWLWKNRQIPGLKFILAGSTLNLLALLLHGGLMPVSEKAMTLTGQDVSSLGNDSRHQLMDSTFTWILGDWIPVLKYVLSPGDLLVGTGIITLVYLNSTVWGK